MSTTQAITTARRKITMHRQGEGWYVSYPCCDTLMVSSEALYAVARERVRRLRIAYALGLLGFDDVYVVYNIVESGERFEIAVREAVRAGQ